MVAAKFFNSGPSAREEPNPDHSPAKAADGPSNRVMAFEQTGQTGSHLDQQSPFGEVLTGFTSGVHCGSRRLVEPYFSGKEQKPQNENKTEVSALM